LYILASLVFATIALAPRTRALWGLAGAVMKAIKALRQVALMFEGCGTVGVGAQGVDADEGEVGEVE
jgi:hypothetical protein